jgi:hypothetical protein
VIDWLPTARQLVTVKCDVALPFDFDALLDKGPDDKKLVELYGRFGFRTLRDRVTNKEDAAEGGETLSRRASPRERGDKRQFARIAAGFMPEHPRPRGSPSSTRASTRQ